MMYWPFLPPEEWAAYLRAQGYDPGIMPPITEPYVEKFVCELCNEDLHNTIHVELDPPPGIIFKRKFHTNCLIAHLLEHLDDDKDDISNYINRKPITP